MKFYQIIVRNHARRTVQFFETHAVNQRMAMKNILNDMQDEIQEGYRNYSGDYTFTFRVLSKSFSRMNKLRRH